MTPEERDELWRDLEAAGCPTLSATVEEDCGLLSREEESELRSLLRREEPEPITEAGLRAEGFEDGDRVALYREFGSRVLPCLSYRKGLFALHAGGAPQMLNITTMQRIREVIAAIEGNDATNNESEESK